MAAEKFIEYFYHSNDDSLFSFQPFYVEFFQNKKPIKVNLKYDGEIGTQFKLVKDTIIINFYLNKFINTIQVIQRKASKKLVEVLQNSEINDNNIARHFLLLHLSKSKLTTQQFEDVLNKIDTIQIIQPFNQLFSYQQFFDKLKDNKIILSSMESVLKEKKFFNSDHLCQNIQKAKLIFFSSQFDKINSFVGLHQIYINLSRIDQLEEKIKKFSTQYQVILVKLYLIKLIINHLFLISIFSSKNDLNVSSEFLAIQPDEQDNLTQFENLAEKIIFKVSIDWHKSVESPNLNLNYLNYFYNNLINKNQLNEFDFEKSGVSIETDAYFLFGIGQSF